MSPSQLEARPPARSAPEAQVQADLIFPLPTPRAWAWAQRFAAALALVAVSPLLAVVFVAVKLTSPGPFLTRSRREGWLGVPIELYKIRTTRVPEPYAYVRQTPIGAVLRRTKIDELPQLWNVVRGDLALVGPRPLPGAAVDHLIEQMPDFAQRRRVVPGLTGLASITTLYDESRSGSVPDFHHWCDADLHYLENRSVGYDLTVLLLTGAFLVRRASASLFRTRVSQRLRGSRTTKHEACPVSEWLDSDEAQLAVRQSSIAWRAAQRGLAGLGLVLLSPLFALMYVAVKVTSPGPFLFAQTRRGFMGRQFCIYKVRTMTVGSEKRTALGVQNSDPAVTRVGRIMRDLKLDELPQLFNILRGDMEIVGPRPVPLRLENELIEKIPGFRSRWLVRPGLTNVSQVSVVDNALDDRLVQDWTLRAEGERHYVANKSLAYDLVMVAMTSLYVARKLAKRVGFTPRREAGAATMVVGSRIANASYATVVDRFRGWIERGEKHRYVCICPVHSLIEGRRDPEHRAALDASDLNSADGMPVVWAQRMLGHRDATRVYGPTLMLRTLEVAAERGWRIGLLGGRPERLDLLRDELAERFEGVEITFAESPPFRPLTDEEDEALVQRIHDAEVDVLWVGLGCPKQEKWMHRHRERLNAIQVGVGAAFDFHAGALRQAPGWMQAMGLEWFFRLACEPRRLFLRYATTNPWFLSLISRQLAARVLLFRRYQVAHAGRRRD